VRSTAASVKIRVVKYEFTSVIEKRGRWYVAYIEEIPGVNTQGRNLAGARRNLRDALTLVIEANRELASWVQFADFLFGISSTR
jgi:predicted RNase H-like HicB family nuclease